MAMGHEIESLDEFTEAHRTCLGDLMYFPTRSVYGLSSVAGNMEKLNALQSEYETVRNKLDDVKDKALRLEKKATVLTQGYEMRAKKSLWPQIESTFKQIDTAATEFECFQALKKQEEQAASHRINNIWEELKKQKELEKILQKRYGDYLSELESIEQVMEQCRIEAKQKEEIEAKQTEEMETQNQSHELTESEADEHVHDIKNSEPEALAIEGGQRSQDSTDDVQRDNVQDIVLSEKVDMDVDAQEEKAPSKSVELVGDSVNNEGGSADIAVVQDIPAVSKTKDDELVDDNLHGSSLEGAYKDAEVQHNIEETIKPQDNGM